jgi:hypothetical protein
MRKFDLFDLRGRFAHHSRTDIIAPASPGRALQTLEVTRYASVSRNNSGGTIAALLNVGKTTENSRKLTRTTRPIENAETVTRTARHFRDRTILVRPRPSARILVSCATLRRYDELLVQESDIGRATEAIGNVQQSHAAEACGVDLRWKSAQFRTVHQPRGSDAFVRPNRRSTRIRVKDQLGQPPVIAVSTYLAS